MTEIDMDKIRAGADWFDACQDPDGPIGAVGLAAAAIRSAGDVPALIAEVDRLRTELDHTRVERDELWDRVDGEAWDRLRAENAKAGRQALLDYRDANHRHNDRAPGWCICGEEWDADADLRCAEYEGLTEAAGIPGGA